MSEQTNPNEQGLPDNSHQHSRYIEEKRAAFYRSVNRQPGASSEPVVDRFPETILLQDHQNAIVAKDAVIAEWRGRAEAKHAEVLVTEAVIADLEAKLERRDADLSIVNVAHAVLTRKLEAARAEVSEWRKWFSGDAELAEYRLPPELCLARDVADASGVFGDAPIVNPEKSTSADSSTPDPRDAEIRRLREEVVANEVALDAWEKSYDDAAAAEIERLRADCRVLGRAWSAVMSGAPVGDDFDEAMKAKDRALALPVPVTRKEEA